MRIIEPGYEMIRPAAFTDEARLDMLRQIEDAARTCYKSNAKNKTPEATAKFVSSLVAAGHEAMIEHVHMSVRFTVDRGVSHEIVRHRIASFAQESTRYCSYDKDKFGNEITVIRPVSFEPETEAYEVWKAACEESEKAYFRLLSLGAAPEFARNVLPTSLKTEIVVTMNLREWRHFFHLRAAGTTGKPHPQMRQVAQPLLKDLQRFLPEIFGDIGA